MLLLFTFASKAKAEARDWNWFLKQITPKMRNALANEAYRILGSKDDVDDVLQEALIIGVSKCAQLRDETKLFQWMFKIVRREAYAHQSKTSIVRLITRIMDVFEIPQLRPDAYLMSEEESKVLRNALNTLDEQSKQLVLLKTSTDMSLKEIAHQLGINYNTVRSKYQRALDALRHRMEEEYEEEAH